jgi:hypothetical protein
LGTEDLGERREGAESVGAEVGVDLDGQTDSELGELVLRLAGLG